MVTSGDIVKKGREGWLFVFLILNFLFVLSCVFKSFEKKKKKLPISARLREIIRRKLLKHLGPDI